jgi:hypothetical protein
LRAGSVLEVQEHAEVRHDRQHHPGASLRRSLGVHKRLRCAPIHDGRDPQQDNEWRVPGRVENVAREKKIDLPSSPPERQGVQREDNRKERCERQCIEYHNPRLIPISYPDVPLVIS